jgi:hypothetical protein
MFSFFQRESLKKALDACQHQLISQGIGMELNDKQYQMLISTSLFSAINSKFKSKGLSQWGGLAWFCAQTTGKILEAIKSGQEVSLTARELAEKSASIALLLGNSIPTLKLTHTDMDAIGSASEIALEWLEVMQSPEDQEITSILSKKS